MYQVLIVDDENKICQGLRSFVKWERYGFSVPETANSVAQALVHMEGRDVDLVITDVRMPVQSGIQLLAVLREEYPDVKAIVLSAYGDFEYAQQAIRLGALDYLTKPVELPELEALLVKVRAQLDGERAAARQQREYLQMQRDSILNNAAKGYDTQLDAERQELCGGAFPGPYRLLRFRLEGNESDRAGLCRAKARLTACAGELLGPAGRPVFFNNELREAACLFFPAKGEGEGLAGLMEELGTRLRPVEFTVGISRLLTEPASLKNGYVQAGRALQCRILKKGVRAILYDEAETLLPEESLLGEEANCSLTTLLLRHADPGEVVELVHSLLDSLPALPGHSGEMYALGVQIMLRMNESLESSGGENPEWDKRLYGFVRRLLLCNDAPAVKGCMREYAEAVCADLARLENSTISGNIAGAMQQYIHEHYAEDLSLAQMAQAFFLHPIYLSRLFKEKTGVNFLDYVTQVRMDRARELLKNPSLKICDISRMVGYESARYFSRLFKSAAGLTPKEYREAPPEQR